MDLKGKRVLITGGLGFIGSNLVHRCHALGAKVTVYDCLDPRSGGNMKNLEPLQNEVNLVLNDLRNFEGLSQAVMNQDLLVNCAAYTSHPNSMKEPYVDLDVNCKGVINLLEALRRFNPEAKLVQVGTSTQIGKMVYSPVDERHPEFPVDIYSANKTASEKYILVYANAYKLRATVIRLANTFGPRCNLKSPEFGFMNYFIGLGLQGKDITVYGDGAQRRTVSYVDDAVEAFLAGAASEASNGQVYFAVGDQQATVLQIATAITEVIGGKIRFVEWPKDRAAIEVGDAVITNKKIREELAWAPRHDLRGGLGLTKDYFASRLKAYL